MKNLLKAIQIKNGNILFNGSNITPQNSSNLGPQRGFKF